ncbi:MAG: phospholipase D family protein [Pseudomonadota bacterium]|nr:phospholipase D family protein [Pseudomonadota bacterium]
MLSPEARRVAIDLLRSPPGHRLERAVLTTYSLDLETLLALPLAVLAHSDGGVEDLLEDPLLLLEALREAGERVHVFVDRAGIGIPRAPRALYAMLERGVHPVSAPNGGAFHPKLWVARFVDADDVPLLRVAVLSRNLTDDRSWDLSLVSEARPAPQRTFARSRALGVLLRKLLALTDPPFPAELTEILSDLAGELERTRFPAPEGFDGDIRFHCVGLGRRRSRPWLSQPEGARLLAMAPFASRTALDPLSGAIEGHCTLISRQEALDGLNAQALANWDECLVLSETAAEEASDDTSGRPSGLHAKAVCIERGWEATWFVGSANLTAAAFLERNVEFMAEISGKKGRSGGRTGCGIERFLESGIRNLCETYRRSAPDPVEIRITAAQERLEQARTALLDADLHVDCMLQDDAWRWTLLGELELPPGVELACWPITLAEDNARQLELPSLWKLPTSKLTAFVAFRLRIPNLLVDDLRLALKLPAEGLPEGRINQVLRALIDSPERLLRFLRALLGGLDALVDWSAGEGNGGTDARWGVRLGGETLLEDLVRAASREPSRLAPVRRLIDDLRKTEEGRRIVPDALLALWQAVDQAAGSREVP